MSVAGVDKTTASDQTLSCGSSVKSPYVATAAEAIKNYQRNEGRTWYNDGANTNDHVGEYAFQRLRQTWFTPKIDAKFRLRRDDKFYDIGSCFLRGLEGSMSVLKIAFDVSSPE